MALGLATAIAATSAPVAVLADEPADPEATGVTATPMTPATQNPGQASQSERTVNEVAAISSGRAEASEAYTGTLQDEEEPAKGEIGTKAQEALDDVKNAEAAVDASNTLYDEAKAVENSLNLLTADTKPGRDGKGQIKNSESMEENAETQMGVTLDKKTGEVKNTDGLDKKVSDANEATKKAEQAKAAAYSKLQGVEIAIGDANDALDTASGKRTTAETDSQGARKAISNNITGVEALDTNTKKQLDGIEDALKKAVSEDDITNAVSAAATASSTALTVAGEQYVIADQALKDANNAANDATQHSAAYTYQQMARLANTAQQAATNAQKAAEAADLAVGTAKEKEAEAAGKVSAAKTALGDAQKDAVDVLSAYKSQLDAINAKIDKANGSRKEAREAMTTANNAIDHALELMDNTDPNAEDAKAAYDAMDKAIEAANKAIKAVTGLIVDDNATKEEKENSKFYKAKERYGWTKQRLDAQISALTTAKTNYDKAIAVSGELEANKQAAETLVAEINELINGENNLYDKWLKDAQVDIDDMRTRLSGLSYTYQQLKDKVDETQQEVDRQGEDLVNQNKALGGSEEDQNLTADQVLEKYYTAVKANETLGTTISTLAGQISEKEQIITDCNSNEGTFMNDLRNASEVLGMDITALDKKYVYSYNDETKAYEFATDNDGKPVYTDAYNDLVAASKEKTEDTVEYKNGDKKLEYENKDYEDEKGNLYQKKPYTTPGSDVDAGNYKPGPYRNDWTTKETVLDQKLVDGYLQEYTEVEYEQPLAWKTDYQKVENGNGSYSVSAAVANSYNSMSDAEKKEFIIKYLCEDKLGIGTVEKIEVSENKATVTVKDPNEYHTNASLVYVFDCEINPKKVKSKNGQYSLNYVVNKFTEQKGTRTQVGTYKETRKYQYNKYERTVVTPGEYTEAALKAQENLKEIDTNADTAKEAVNGHLKAQTEADKKYNQLLNDRADAAKDLYGYDGKNNASRENPTEGSLMGRKKKDDATFAANQTIIDGLKVLAYETALNYKKGADANLKQAEEFDPLTAEGVSETDKDKYRNAVAAKQRIQDAKDMANGYLAKINGEKGALVGLESKIAAAVDQNADNAKKDGVAKYNTADGLITDASNRMSLVETKLNNLQAEYGKAVDNLTTDGALVDTKTKGIGVSGKVDVATLYHNIVEDLVALGKKKFTDFDDYKDIAHVHSEYDKLKQISLASVSETLAARISTLVDQLTEAEGSLTEIAGVREEAEKKAEEVHGLAKLAQDAADRAAAALRAWRAPEDEERSSSGTPDADTGAVVVDTGADLLTGFGLPALTLTTGGRTVARGGAADGSGVLGARTDEQGTKDEVKTDTAEDTTEKKVADQTDETQQTTITEGDLAGAQNPYENGSSSFAAWVIGLLAAAAAGGAGYGIYRKKAGVNADNNRNKKN